MANPSVSVVFPAYNEEENIEATVARCARSLERLTDRFEIVIVDDCSTDGMPQIADRLAAEDERVRIIHNPVNLGAGTSVWIGLKAARCEVVVHDSMDYPFDLDDLDRVLPLFAEWDVVAIFRSDRSANSPWRKITSITNYWLIRGMHGAPFRDMNFVQAYRREVVQSVTIKAKSPAFVTPELLIRAHAKGFRCTEIEATFHARTRGRASYGKPRDILWSLAENVSLFLERRISRSRDV